MAPSSAVVIRFFSMRHRGIIDTAKTCSRGQEDNTSQPKPPKVLRTMVRPVFIPFKGDPASKSRFLKDSSIIPAFASVVQATKSRSPLIFRFVHSSRRVLSYLLLARSLLPRPRNPPSLFMRREPSPEEVERNGAGLEGEGGKMLNYSNLGGGRDARGQMIATAIPVAILLSRIYSFLSPSRRSSSAFYFVLDLISRRRRPLLQDVLARLYTHIMNRDYRITASKTMKFEHCHRYDTFKMTNCKKEYFLYKKL